MSKGESDVTMVDKSGEPRSLRDIEDALRIVEQRIVKADFSDPGLFLVLPGRSETACAAVSGAGSTTTWSSSSPGASTSRRSPFPSWSGRETAT